MRTATLQFTQSARRVYTSVKRAVEKCGQFRHVVPNDDIFVITARHGMSLLALGEKITIRVVATGTQSSKVVIESRNQIFINIPISAPTTISRHCFLKGFWCWAKAIIVAMPAPIVVLRLIPNVLVSPERSWQTISIPPTNAKAG